MKKVVAIFGYNNTRLYDVVKLKKMIKDRCKAELLLIRECITSSDKEVTPYCLEYNPDDPAVVSPLRNYLELNNLKLAGCLPFSDKGVIGASHAAKEFGLFFDDTKTSFAMLNKFDFRKLEKELSTSSSYKKPFFEIAKSEYELKEFLKTNKRFFLKPTSEGNSRGCMKIENENDLNLWLKENYKSLNAGVICEEILSIGNEFSFDGVAGNYWITQKFTTEGVYKAEYQHIMPAPLNSEMNQTVYENLEPLIKNLGSNGGAFHHEFFITEDSRIASVEPNRRPAGMWLWDLACNTFENFNPWESWLDVCTGEHVEKTKLRPKHYSGVRGVISRKNGILRSADVNKIEKELRNNLGSEYLKFSFLKKEKEIISNIPKDNSDFIAFISTSDPDYKNLLIKLDLAEKIILNNIEVV